MRILIYNWRDMKNPRAGGAEVYTYEIAKRLVERGHKTTWFTAAFPGCKREEIIDGIKIIRAGGRLGVYLQAKRHYRRRFKGEFDVVVDEINTRPFMTPSFVKEPIVAVVFQLAREFWFYETPFPISYIGYHWLENRWLSSYINVPTVTISKSTGYDLKKLGFVETSIVPIGLKIDPVSDIPGKEDRPTLLFVGRMGKAKLPDHALEAFRYVRQEIPEVQLWMVGDGSMRKKLMWKNMLKDVTFFGRVSEKEKLDLMKRAHVLLVPGVREGWGLVVTEANAMGTPAVGYDVHGLRDSIQHGKTGLLCRNRPDEMAKAVVTLLTQERTREELSRNALEWAREFDYARSAEMFEEVLVAAVE